ncbi:Hypothetical protein, putative [Bodo saltans]|uniref:Uncharacterized protein n=1 Tax=Bodo saltans TaxID=75058 RepID=A0A0S4JUF1_BODSA|nr:Hypothetical protein, putative [Bodo saltans]|eukprot:CUG93863.1 Hypothetical protein, putative [Bodo saltans]
MRVWTRCCLCEAEGPSADQRREEAGRQQKERNDAQAAVVGARQRDLSQQRAERQQQRDNQRSENLKRLEEQKRLENENKLQKIEEREKKVQAQLQSAQADAEARKARSEERLQHSAIIREEQREKQKQKLEKTEQKLKDAKERRDHNDGGSDPAASFTNSKPTFSEALLPLSSAEEEAVSQRIAKSVTSWNRQAKTFLDNYQKESALSAKDTNKSRLRPLVGRLNPASLVACRGALNDIIALSDLADLDHEFVRHSNVFDVLLKVFMEARKGHDFQILKLTSDAIRRQGRPHAY